MPYAHKEESYIVKRKKHTPRKLAALMLSALLGMTTLGGTAYAGETMDVNLDDSIQMALANNRTLKQSIASRDSARWGLSLARRTKGPTLSWQGTAYRIGGHDYDSARENYYAGLIHNSYRSAYGNTVTLSYPLYTGGQLESNIESAKYALNSADLSLENTLQTVKATATQYYYDILQARNTIEVREQSVSTLTEHLENVNAQYHVGIVAKSDVLYSQVELANAQQALVTAKNNYDVAISTLNNYIGLPTDTILVPKDQLTYTKYDLTLPGCTAFALENRPDQVVANYAVKQAEEAKSAAKAGYRPTVNAMVTKDLTGSREFKHDMEDNWAAGLSANWNIFDNGVTNARVHQADAALIQAQEQAAATNEAIQLEVRQAYLNMLAAEKNISTTQVAVTQAEEDYKIAQVRYSAGVDTNLAVMDAEEKLTEARMNYYTALYDYNTSKASLDKAMGIPVGIDVTRYVTAAEAGKSANKAREDAAIVEDAKKQPKAEKPREPVLAENPDGTISMPSQLVEEDLAKRDMSDGPKPAEIASLFGSAQAPAAQAASSSNPAQSSESVEAEMAQ